MECGHKGVVSKSSHEVITVAKKIEFTVQLGIGLCFRSSAIEHVGHEALWLVLLNEVRQSGARTPNFSVTDCDDH